MSRSLSVAGVKELVTSVSTSRSRRRCKPAPRPFCVVYWYLYKRKKGETGERTSREVVRNTIQSTRRCPVIARRAFVDLNIYDRKDKNGADTLAAVNRIEPKVHETHDKVLESHQYIELIYEKFNSLPAFLASVGGSHELSMGTAQQTPSQTRPTAWQKGQHQYVSAVHKMMAWRVVRQTLEAVHPKITNLETVFTEEPYPSAMLEQQGLMSLPHVGVDAHSPSRLPTAFVMGQIPQGWPWNKQYLESRSAVYFDSFNLIHPVLDHKLFVEVTLPSALYDSMQDSAESTLVLLVMALAEMALAEGSDFSISQSNYRVALEGTAVNVPPGLDFFNEARRRMGFSMADCTLENVQIFVLAG